MEGKPTVLTEVTQDGNSHELPRFTWRHFCVWLILTTDIAILLYSARHAHTLELTDPDGQYIVMALSTQQIVIRDIGSIFMGAVASASFLGMGMLLASKWRGRSFPFQPGHFFVGAISLIYLCVLFGNCFKPDLQFAFYLWTAGIISLIAGTGFFVKYIHYCDTRPWRFALGFFSGMLILTGISSLSILFNTMLSFLIGGPLSFLLWGIFGLAWLAILVAIGLDRHERISRDSLHWLGVGVFAAMSLWWCVSSALG